MTFPAGRVPTESWAGSLRALTGTAWPADPLWICTVRMDDARRIVLGRDGRAGDRRRHRGRCVRRDPGLLPAGRDRRALLRRRRCALPDQRRRPPQGRPRPRARVARRCRPRARLAPQPHPTRATPLPAPSRTGSSSPAPARDPGRRVPTECRRPGSDGREGDGSGTQRRWSCVRHARRRCAGSSTDATPTDSRCSRPDRSQRPVDGTARVSQARGLIAGAGRWGPPAARRARTDEPAMTRRRGAPAGARHGSGLEASICEHARDDQQSSHGSRKNPIESIDTRVNTENSTTTVHANGSGTALPSRVPAPERSAHRPDREQRDGDDHRGRRAHSLDERRPTSWSQLLAARP